MRKLPCGRSSACGGPDGRVPSLHLFRTVIRRRGSGTVDPSPTGGPVPCSLLPVPRSLPGGEQCSPLRVGLFPVPCSPFPAAWRAMPAATGGSVPCSPFPVPCRVASNARCYGRACSLFPVPCSPFPVPCRVASNARRYGRVCSLLPVPCYPFPVPCGVASNARRYGRVCSLFPVTRSLRGGEQYSPLRAGLFPAPCSLLSKL